MKKLIAALAVGAAVIVAPLAAEAHHKDGHERGKPERIEICHVFDADNDNVRGEEGERRTKIVSERALKGHLGHGDTRGACPVVEP